MRKSDEDIPSPIPEFFIPLISREIRNVSRKYESIHYDRTSVS